MIDVWSVAIATSGLFFAGILKGATGLGYASCALPFLVVALGLKPAMALVIIPAMSTNIGVAVATAHFKETAKSFMRLYLAIVPGVLVGVWLLLWVDQEFAVRTLGTVSVGYVVFALAKPNFTLHQQWHTTLQVPAGFVNGVVSGLTGSQVMPLFPYLMSLQLSAERMVQAANLAVLTTSTVLVGGLLFSGIMSWNMLGASLVAICPALLGVSIGVRARSRISEHQFRTVTLTVIGTLGLLLMAR